jgi:cytochrome c oxidase assembly factor 3
MASNPHTTYYDRRYRQGASLVRARRPYLVKNAVTGLALTGIVAGICKYNLVPPPDHLCDIPRYSPRPFANSNILTDTYTMRQVGQDDFEDVKVPDAPRAPSASK